MPPVRLSVQNSRSLDGDYLWKTVDQFYSTYFSGLDARVYAGSVLLDELISLQYQGSEPCMPLFGYAAYTWDSIVRGCRHFQGSFTINFKRESYILDLLNNLSSGEQRPAVPAATFRETAAFRTARGGTATLEDFIALSAGASASRDPAGNVRLDPTLIEKNAQAFQQALWGIQNTTHGSSSVQGVDQATSDRLQFNRPKYATPHGFDLSIQFASVDPKHSLEFQAIQHQAVAAGEIARAGEVAEVAVSSTRRLLGVEIIGVQSMVDDSGRPILEEYTWMARELD